MPADGTADRTSATGHSSGVAVDDYRPADEQGVLELVTAAFGRWPNGLDVDPRAFFRWKHESSPFGPSFRLVARVDGKLAGFLGMMPWRLSFAGTVRETVRGVDLAVAPEFQNLGVAAALIAASRRGYSPDTVMSWSNPNKRSRSGVLRAGRKRVDGIPRFVGAGGAGWGTAKHLFAPAAARPADDSLAAALAEESLLERVLPRPGADRRIATALDADFLRWRYGGQGDYRAVVGEHPRGGGGIAIFRIQPRGRFSIARVCELLIERDDDGAASALLDQVRRRAGADFLSCAFDSPSTARRCRMVRSTRTTMVAANPLRDDISPDPTRPACWALSLGDLELI